MNSTTKSKHTFLATNPRQKTSKADKKKGRSVRAEEEVIQLRKQLTRGKMSNDRSKAKNGNSIEKTAQPIVKTVRPSSRGNQNFEAATRYKSRNRKNAIKPKRAESRSINTYSSTCLLYTSPSPRDRQKSRMPSSA